MLAWGLAQLGGSLCLLWQPVLPHPGVFLLSLPVALAAFARPRSRWLAAFWVGAALSAWHATAALDDRLDPALEGRVVDVIGRIASLVEHDGRRTRFLFEIETGVVDGVEVVLPRRVRLSLYDELEVATGERWRWRVKLRRARGLANPGTFDYERWLFAERIGATGYVRDAHGARRLEAASGEWRAEVATRVAEIVRGPAGGLLRGLATADRSGITDGQWDLLRVTGTAHLMAISGLHIGLVAGLGLAVTGFVRRRWFPDAAVLWPPLAGGCLALCYGALAGFGLPVQRALLGALVLLGALALRRAVLPGHAYGLALTTVLCVDPLAPLDIGFWLSFGAVAAILYLLAGRRPLHAMWRRALWIQAGLFVLMAPMTLLGFGVVPLVSPAANLVAIPLFGVAVVPLVLAATALVPWPALSSGVFGAAGWLLERLLEVLGLLAAFDPRLAPANPGPTAWLLAVLALLLLLAPRAWPGRALAPVLLLPALWPNVAADPDAPPLAVHFLDVGQGAAVVVETPDHTLIYDTGPSFGGTDAAELVVAPFVKARGRRPDLVLVSHADNDHAGGLESLRRHFPGARVAGRLRGKHDDCAGMSWRWNEVRFEMLHPPSNLKGSSNDASCVLRLAYGEHDVLLTGDVEGGGEARLLRESREALDVEVVQVPHHGSMTSSAPGFVTATKPLIAIASAGFGNRWNFPRAEIVRRWQASGARVLNTGEQGAITIRFDREGMTLHSFRHERRLWREPAVRDDSGFP